jgi:hypothetical protein
MRISVRVPAAPASLFTEHVDATGQKTGIEEGAEDRPRHPLFLRAHRAPYEEQAPGGPTPGAFFLFAHFALSRNGRLSAPNRGAILWR